MLIKYVINSRESYWVAGVSLPDLQIFFHDHVLGESVLEIEVVVAVVLLLLQMNALLELRATKICLEE